jgi:hypothetical protein
MKWPSSNRPRSVLGLTLTGDRLSLCHLTRSNGTAGVIKSATLLLPSDPLRAEPPAAGLLLRQQLTTADIRERHCVVALPPGWLMSRQTKTPELAPEDLAGFLQLEAEKGFPIDPAQLRIARSTCRTGGATHVTQLAVRQEQIERLAATLTAAGLKPVSFTAGLAALPDTVPAAGAGRITIASESADATLLVGAGGGIAALRTCDATAALARELRITFEQIPPELRATLRELHLRGDETAVRPIEAAVVGWARAAGLTMAPRDAGSRPLGEHIAEAVGRRWLEGAACPLEFLPPRPGRLAAWLAGYDSKRLALAGATAASLAVIALALAGWQEYQRWSLRSEWNGMKTQVTDLTAVQTLIRDYRPWYDTSFHSLGILRGVTESFPDNGSVTAKSFELHGPAGVSISGTARDNASLLRTLDQLRKTRQVRELKIEQIRGKAPLQFTLSLRWTDAPGS